MSRLKNLRPTTLIAFAALLVALGGTAYAADLISGKDIKSNTITSPKIKNQTLKTKDLNKKTIADLKGATGPAGPAGPAGEDGTDGTAVYANPEWGPIHRNTIGSPAEVLAAGPIVGTAANQKPPYGVGSLSLEVNAVPGDASNPGTEKASWGNQVDFAGVDFSSINALGFHVFQTGENAGKGNPNMPSIAMELDSNLTAVPASDNFTTMTFLAAQSTSDRWSGYIDATTTPASPSGTGFILSGAEGTATGCTLATPCTFSALKTALQAGTGAKILTVGITKGRDFAWQGAVDGLRINGTVFDFEPFGVVETTP